MRELSKFVVEERKRCGLTQIRLAKLMGWRPENLCAVEKGRRGLGLETFRNLALALGQKPSALYAKLCEEGK